MCGGDFKVMRTFSSTLANDLFLVLWLFYSPPLLSRPPFAVVAVSLTRTDFRRLESSRVVTVCVTKDLETTFPFNVTLIKRNGTAQRKFTLVAMVM